MFQGLLLVSLLSAVQHTTQTLYNFWFALWLVAKVTFTLSKMNGNITIKEQSKSKHVQGTKQSGLQCFKWHTWHLMSQNDTKHAVSSTRCSAFRVLALDNCSYHIGSLFKTATNWFKAQEPVKNKSVSSFSLICQ